MPPKRVSFRAGTKNRNIKKTYRGSKSLAPKTYVPFHLCLDDMLTVPKHVREDPKAVAALAQTPKYILIRRRAFRAIDELLKLCNTQAYVYHTTSKKTSPRVKITETVEGGFMVLSIEAKNSQAEGSMAHMNIAIAQNGDRYVSPNAGSGLIISGTYEGICFDLIQRIHYDNEVVGEIQILENGHHQEVRQEVGQQVTRCPVRFVAILAGIRDAMMSLGMFPAPLFQNLFVDFPHLPMNRHIRSIHERLTKEALLLPGHVGRNQNMGNKNAATVIQKAYSRMMNLRQAKRNAIHEELSLLPPRRGFPGGAEFHRAKKRAMEGGMLQ